MSSNKIRKIGKSSYEQDQPQQKRFKSNHDSENKPTPTMDIKQNCVISNLTDCCFDHILQHLSIDDLKSFRQTCRRLYKVTGDYFQRINSNERLTVHSYQVNEQTKIEIIPANKKVRNFHRFIRNIKLMPSNQLHGYEPIDLFVYLRFNCCQNLKKLILCRINCFQSAERYGTFIHDQLATLEIIEFDSCQIPDIHIAFLKHCPRINSLTIKLIDKFHWNALFNYGLTWTYQHYPNLKHIQLSYVGAHYLNIDSFLDRNTQIESVTSSSIHVIKSVCRNQMKLRQLTLQYVDEGFLERISQMLTKYCEQKCVERVNIGCVANPLKLSTKRITTLGILKEFQGFQFWFNRKNVLLMTSTLASIKQLKMLSIQFLRDMVTLDVLETIAQHVPTLEILHFDLMLGPKPFGDYTFQQIIMPFVRNSTQLKEIAFHCPYFNRIFFQKTDLIDLIAVRGNVNNACAFNIYLDSNVIHKIQFIVPVNSLIAIKPISIIDKCSCLSHSILYW